MSTSPERWNPLQLLETLNFFGEVPFLGNFRWLQQMFGAPSNPQAPTATDLAPEKMAVLMIQDESLANQVRTVLAEQGWGTRSQLMPLDSPLPASESNRIINTQVYVWGGVPGDEECLTAQTEDLQSLPASEDIWLFDFRSADTNIFQETWGAVDDVVMGGVSASGITLLPGFAQFSGTVSTANSGGFASVRTRNFDPPFDLSGWQGIRLVVRGDGQRYKVILRNSGNWDSLAYCTSIDTVADQWLGIDIPFSALQPTFRARTQPTAPPLNPARVCSFQLMLSKFEYDGEKNPEFSPGAFSLDVRSLGVYRRAPQPLLIAIATSANQFEAYTTVLAQSGMPHQVLDRSQAADFSTALQQALTVQHS
jgi:hypothetical protein